MKYFVEYNKTYTVRFVAEERFHFTKMNELVDYTDYFRRIFPRLDDVIKDLQKNPDSRQGVITINENEDFMSCLMYVQFQLINNVLQVTATFRSQHEILGRPHDERLLRYLATEFKKNIGIPIHNIRIQVWVGNYHNYNEKEKLK